MQLSSEELTELAGFFARRFPSPEEVDALARAVGLQAGEEGAVHARWGALLLGAQARGRLLELVRAARARAPGDANLDELCRALEADRAASRRPLLLVGVVLLAAGLGALAWQALTPAPAPPPAPPRGIETVPDFTAAAPADAAPADAAPAGPTPADAAPEAAEEAAGAVAEAPVTPPTQAPAGAALDAASAPASAPTGPVLGRCGGAPGEVVGYWYAGDRSPGAVGQVYTVRAGANVRRDYPRRANDWNARAPLVCALLAGDRVRLGLEPILVDGGRYWVPLTPEDLLTRDAPQGPR